MFKAKKSEENIMQTFDNNTSKLQDENYLKNNYFSRTVEENDNLKKEVEFQINTIFLEFFFFRSSNIKSKKFNSLKL